MAVRYTAQADLFAFPKPHAWSDARVEFLGTYTTWDVAPDGKHLAAILTDTGGESKAPMHLTFLFHFGDELQRRTAAVGR